MALNAIPRILALLSGSGAAVGLTPAAQGGVASAFSIPALNAAGQLDVSFMPPGEGPEVTVATATEAIISGGYVQVLPQPAVGGVAQPPTVRNADASANKAATHFIMAAAAQGAANVSCFRVGQNAQVSGVTPGDVWLSDTTPGAVTSTPPTTAGHLVQKLGQALSASNIDTKIGDAILLS